MKKSGSGLVRLPPRRRYARNALAARNPAGRRSSGGGAGEPAFYDMHHLSLSFSTFVGRRMASVYADELKLAGFPPPNRSR
jgi:hypothetical protein